MLNAHGTTYRMDLQDAIQQMVESGPEQAWIDRPGGVFLRRTDLMPAEDVLLLRATARAVMEGAEGDLSQQLVRPSQATRGCPTQEVQAHEAGAGRAAVPAAAARSRVVQRLRRLRRRRTEYVIRVQPSAGLIPPAPWVNVVAHPTFGFAASDLGTGFTWSENSHDNRLTPWRNDPVGDPPGEAIYLRDDDSGRVWSATPLPAGGGQPTRSATAWATAPTSTLATASSRGCSVFVAAAEPVKVFQIALRNTSNRRRQISVTLYVEWVLGENRERTGASPSSRAASRLRARSSPRTRFAMRSRIGWPFSISSAASDARSPATGRSSSAATARSRRRRRSRARRSPIGPAPTIDPCGAIQVR